MKKKTLIIICLITTAFIFSCQSDDNTANNEDSVKIESSDSSQVINSEMNEKDLDSISETETIIADKIQTKFICPLGDAKGNLNKPGDCPDCGMELIENPDYKEEK